MCDQPYKKAIGLGGIVMIHLGALAVLMLWILSTPYAERQIYAFFDWISVGQFDNSYSASSGGTATSWHLPGSGVILALVVTLSIELIVQGLGRTNITIQRILLATFFVGFWCVALANIPQVAWYGKCQRVQWRLEALESLALALSQQWPDRDGEIEGLGPFVAYPIGKPSTLLLLAPTPLDRTDLVVTAITRSDACHSIRFQLGGSEVEDWIEFHPFGNPCSYTSGLSQEYDLKLYSMLKHNWFLVRYIP